MQRLLKKRSKKAGLAPGTLVHIGERITEVTEISIFKYDESHFSEKEFKSLEEYSYSKDEKTITWINVEGVHDLNVLEKFGAVFGIHPLALEDIANTDQRPKVEDFGSNIYIVFKMFSFNELTSEIFSEQVSLILDNNFVISFQEGIKGDVFNPIRERIRNNKGKIRRLGADYLMYSLIDGIIDNYFIVLEKLGEKIEILEEQVIKNPSLKIIQEIHNLKREIILLRKSVWPLREVISGLQRGDSQLIKESTKIYLRDIYDHTIQIIDTVETFKDMLSSMLEIYLSSTNNKMNEIIRIITIIATIFMPPTFIAGVYGMNFKFMPELDWIFGYPSALLLMAITTVSMLAYFKKRRWI